MSESLKPRVDFHIHYDPLDEQRTAFQAIDIAAERNVVAMVLLARSEISSHFDEFIEHGRCVGVDVIPGVEHVVIKDNKKIGLICIGFDPEERGISDYFDGASGDAQSVELARFQRDLLVRRGFNLTVLNQAQSDLLKRIMAGKVTEKAINLCEIAAGIYNNRLVIRNLIREHYSDWISVRSKYSEMPNYKDNPTKLIGKFLWTIFFEINKDGFVPLSEHVEKVVDITHEAGGVVLYSPEGSFDAEFWEELQGNGVDGIMAWHAAELGNSSKGRSDIPSFVIRDARKRGLLILGGSDYQQKDWEVGIGNGNMFISPKRYGEFLDFIRSRNGGRLPWKVGR